MPLPSHFTPYKFRPDPQAWSEFREDLFPAELVDNGPLPGMVDARATDLESSITVRMDKDLRGHVRAVASSFGMKDAELIRRLCYSAFASLGEFVAVDQPAGVDHVDA